MSNETTTDKLQQLIDIAERNATNRERLRIAEAILALSIPFVPLATLRKILAEEPNNV